MVEVLIAGAGPAGALAALILARAGVRVLVADRARFPRHKLCGDTLNPGALRLLARHGLAEPIVARGLAIEGMLVTSGTGVRVRGVYGAGLTGRSLLRRDLDQMLIEAAVSAGAQFQDRVRVAAPIVDGSGNGARVYGATLSTADGRTLRVPALVTIAADGRRSPLAFALRLAHQPAWPRRWAIGGYMMDVDGMDTVGEMHIRQGHYIGVAPLPDGLVNVCYVTPGAPERTGARDVRTAREHDHDNDDDNDGRGARPELADPARALVARLAADPLLRDRMTRARLVEPVTLLGPLAVDVPVAGMPGLLLAGDAAGFVDPMTGDGLRFALRGAELAAAVALRELEHEESIGHLTLTALRARELSNKYRFNRGLRALVGSDLGVRAGTLGARVAPGVLRRLIRYAGDTRTREFPI